ncbi:syncytin-2-like [Trichosurus vulpecula]|uniref:syncytin-2-like n=1 Tax=Trichosurus vulpecula TaxID=9337 RepID=UPI00186B086F|nr:syncytin-2-like [Trichosurus vulpecula]
MRKLGQEAVRLFNLSSCWLCIDPLGHTSVQPISASDWGSVELIAQAHPTDGLKFSEKGTLEKPTVFRKTEQANSDREFDLLLSAPYFRKHLRKNRIRLHLNASQGPVFSKATWASTAPSAAFCYLSNHSSGIPVGSLDPARCNYTIWIRPGESMEEKSNSIYVSLPSPWILGTNTTQGNSDSRYCSGRPARTGANPCYNDWSLISVKSSPGSCLKLWPDKTGNETIYWDHYRGYLWAENGYGPVSGGITNNPCLNPSMGLLLSQSRLLYNNTPSIYGKGPYTLRGSRVTVNQFPGSLIFSLTLPRSLGMFFLCGDSLYQTLPPRWSGLCTIVRAIPDLRYIPGTTPIPVSLQDLIVAEPSSPARPFRFRRAIPILPLVVGGSILAATGVGTAGLITANDVYRDLSREMADMNDRIAKVIGNMQNELGSLAGMVLQNRRALDALLAAQGGVCVFLEEECCFYVNKSQQIQDSINDFRSHATQLREKAVTDQWYDMFSSLSPRLGSFLRSLLLSASGVLTLFALVLLGIRLGLTLTRKCSKKIMLSMVIFPWSSGPTMDMEISSSPQSTKEGFLELPFQPPEEE